MLAMTGDTSRRAFLRSSLLLGGAAVALTTGVTGQQDSLSGTGESGTLRDPYSVGRPRDRATAADNDEGVKAIERQLKCSCGCNLDIFTCRTTDFTCETSPRLHKQVLGLYQGGFSDSQIIQQFVDQYGEQTLMAPRPEGFNIAGYVLPGAGILIAGTILALYLTRRREVAVAEGPVSAPASLTMPPVEATPEELEELKRAVQRDDE
jgi:cytochrome c-type biogenesis protein CcmH/NrfF